MFKEKECMVDLTLPIASLEFIETLMPQKVLNLLAERNFDLKALLHEVRASNYQPQTLFEMSTTERAYKVWIV